MKREQKHEEVQALVEQLSSNKNFYVADTSALNAGATSDLRRMAHERGIKIRVMKNTLIRKALEQSSIDNQELFDTLKGNSALFFAESNTAPAKFIKEFRKTHAKPLLKVAYIEESVYVGDEQLDTLVALKGREELIAEVVALLQSPMRNVISGLQGGGQKIAGLLKTLSERDGQ